MIRCMAILCLCYTLVTTEYGAYSDGYHGSGGSSPVSPGSPGYRTPGSPGYRTPGSPGYRTPGSPGYRTPGSPGYRTRGSVVHPGTYDYEDAYNFCVPTNEDPDADCIPGQAGADYPVYALAPSTGFSCQSQPYPGYYADQNTQCQVFHICQHDGRHDSFLCPNGSIFNQQYFVCDWWYNVDCRIADSFYGLNADLYRDPYRGLGSYGQTAYGGAYSPGVPGAPYPPGGVAGYPPGGAAGYPPGGAAGYPPVHDPHNGPYSPLLPDKHGYRHPSGLVDPSGPKVKPYSQAVGLGLPAAY